jgi:hypothetical protein
MAGADPDEVTSIPAIVVASQSDETPTAGVPATAVYHGATCAMISLIGHSTGRHAGSQCPLALTIAPGSPTGLRGLVVQLDAVSQMLDQVRDGRVRGKAIIRL